LNALIKGISRERIRNSYGSGLGMERNIDIAKLPEDAAYNLTVAAFREGTGRGVVSS